MSEQALGGVRVVTVQSPVRPPVDPTQAFTRQLADLRPCEPWSLDQLERFVWLLGGHRQLERFALLGCWPVDADRFACVLDHPSLGRVGLVVERNPVEAPRDAAGIAPSVHLAVDHLLGLWTAEVRSWQAIGWERDGVVWNTDPTGLTTPWAGSRPPLPGDGTLGADVVGYFDHLTPPSGHPDPRYAALQDLQGWVEHPLWASTFLAKVITHLPGELRNSLRLAAAWALAPDVAVLVQSHIWPIRAEDRERTDEALLRRIRLPGQRYLRVGTLVLPNLDGYTGYWSQTYDGDDVAAGVYPRGVVHQHELRHGIAWGDLHSPVWRPVLDWEPVDRMARALHKAVDRAG
ncbi:hypothetical protein [Desertihabitans aurantiacus]|uniref:hypothetical protein n=1 Tax=Desertihabitans aurantiacus TaxID=2282477 RepID=UPI000DF75451|nr:hypothetical protein [Desertihabitans aurantiacus]